MARQREQSRRQRRSFAASAIARGGSLILFIARDRRDDDSFTRLMWSRPVISPTFAPVAQHRDRGLLTATSFVELRGSDQQRQALGAETADQDHDFRMRADIDAASRIVENENSRARNQRPRQHHLLLVSARKLTDRFLRVRGRDRQRLDHFAAPALPVRPRPSRRSHPRLVCSPSTIFSRTLSSPKMPSALRSSGQNATPLAQRLPRRERPRSPSPPILEAPRVGA